MRSRSGRCCPRATPRSRGARQGQQSGTILHVYLYTRCAVQVLKDAQQKRKVLPKGDPAQQRVERIGRQIAAAASDGTGGGFQKHMKVRTRLRQHVQCC